MGCTEAGPGSAPECSGKARVDLPARSQDLRRCAPGSCCCSTRESSQESSPRWPAALAPPCTARSTRFEDLGEDALLDQRKLRARSKVTADVEQRLVGYIDGSPQDFGW